MVCTSTPPAHKRPTASCTRTCIPFERLKEERRRDLASKEEPKSAGACEKESYCRSPCVGVLQVRLSQETLHRTGGFFRSAYEHASE